jgi:hypothetical protein
MNTMKVGKENLNVHRLRFNGFLVVSLLFPCPFAPSMYKQNSAKYGELLEG